VPLAPLNPEPDSRPLFLGQQQLDVAAFFAAHLSGFDFSVHLAEDDGNGCHVAFEGLRGKRLGSRFRGGHVDTFSVPVPPSPF
jgi:hypothetical protein